MKYLLLILTIFITSCNTYKEENILTVGNGNDVVVKLNIKDNTNINKIEFYSDDNKVFIEKKEIETYNTFIYKFKNKGEGTFKTCIIKNNDTICIENYVENGYSPKIEFIKDSLMITEHF